MKIEIDDSHLNSLMAATLKRSIETCKHAHHTDLQIRINGEDRFAEADWVKHMRITEDYKGQ